VNSSVPLGTATPVRSGTDPRGYRGPKSPEIIRSSTACRARNFPNELNLTCCCEPACCEQVDWRDRSSRFQCLTNTPIRQYDFVFGDTPCTRAYARARELHHRQYRTFTAAPRCCANRAEANSLTRNPSNSFRRTTLVPPLGIDIRDLCGRIRSACLLSWTAGCSNASLTLYFSARHSSNEGAAA
jgi:hypothetical protein